MSENDGSRQENNNFSRITITNIALGSDGFETGPPPGVPNWFQMPHAIFLRTGDGGDEVKHRASKRAIRRLKRIAKEEELSDRTCSICFEEFEPPEKRSQDDDPPESVPDTMVEDPPESVPVAMETEDPPESAPEDGQTTGEEDPPESAPNEDNEGENGEDSHIAVQMPCGHQFGLSCLKSWLKESNTCPMCRTTIESQSEYLRATGQPQEEHPLLAFMSRFMNGPITRLSEMTSDVVARERERARRERDGMHANSETANDDTANSANSANSAGSANDDDPPESVIEEERPRSEGQQGPRGQQGQYRLFHLPLDEGIRTFIAPFLGNDENSGVRITFERFATIFRDRLDSANTTSQANASNPTTPTDPANHTNPTGSTSGDNSFASQAPNPPSTQAGTIRTPGETSRSETPLQETSGSGSSTVADRSRSRANRDARHHPYANATSTSDSIRTRFNRGEMNRRDLQCAMIPMQLCVHSLDEETNQQRADNPLVRLACGHGYHEGCLRWCMRTHGDAEIPNLHPQDATAEVWCTRCRRYRQVL